MKLTPINSLQCFKKSGLLDKWKASGLPPYAQTVTRKTHIITLSIKMKKKPEVSKAQEQFILRPTSVLLWLFILSCNSSSGFYVLSAGYLECLGGCSGSGASWTLLCADIYICKELQVANWACRAGEAGGETKSCIEICWRD